MTDVHVDSCHIKVDCVQEMRWETADGHHEEGRNRRKFDQNAVEKGEVGCHAVIKIYENVTT